MTIRRPAFSPSVTELLYKKTATMFASQQKDLSSSTKSTSTTTSGQPYIQGEGWHTKPSLIERINKSMKGAVISKNEEDIPLHEETHQGTAMTRPESGEPLKEPFGPSSNSMESSVHLPSRPIPSRPTDVTSPPIPLSAHPLPSSYSTFQTIGLFSQDNGEHSQHKEQTIPLHAPRPRLSKPSLLTHKLHPLLKSKAIIDDDTGVTDMDVKAEMGKGREGIHGNDDASDRSTSDKRSRRPLPPRSTSMSTDRSSPELFSPSESTSLAAVLSDPGTVSPFGPPFVHSYGYGGGNSQRFGIGVGGLGGVAILCPSIFGIGMMNEEVGLRRLTPIDPSK